MRKGLKSGGLLLLVGYLIFAGSSGAYAQQLTISDRWLTDSVQLNVGSVVSDNVTCDKAMKINVVDSLIKLPSSYDACVEVGKTLNIAHYKDAQNYPRVAVQRTANGNYYRIEIENLVSVNPHLLPNTDTLVLSDNIGNNSYEYTNFVTLDKLGDHLKAQLTPDGIVIAFSLDMAYANRWFPYEYGSLKKYVGVTSYTWSNNGRYILAKIYSDGFAVIDLKTGITRMIAIIPGAYYDGQLAATAGAVSDDGSLAYISGPELLYESMSCGDVISPSTNPVMIVSNTCRSRSFMVQIIDSLGYRARSNSVKFSSMSTISFTTVPIERPYTVTPPRYKAELSIQANMGGSTHRYLALGDSYTSGEGDIDQYGVGQYLPGTNVVGDYKKNIPNEMCHQSEHAYPFILATRAGLQQHLGMDTVACSGAVRINLAKTIGSSGYFREYVNGQYLGQLNTSGKPRLKGLSNVSDFQTQALTSLIPGRIQQIEQLKAQQPDVATVQISGNDLRFGPILTSCILNWAGRVGKALGADQKDCDWSKAKFRADIASAIETNGSQLESLYKDLQAASPSTQLYAVGYPLFVKQAAVCWNIPTLSAAEQEFIVESIKYVNQTIKSAAARASIRYIDIQDALGDQVMCGKGGAMTDPLDYVSSGIMAALKRGETVDQIAREYGLVDPASKMLLAALYNNMKNVEDTVNFAQNPLVNLASVVQQLSHPNAEGHRLIANKIIDAISDGGSILAASCDEKVIFCPNSNNMVEATRPTYFGPALTRTGIVVEIASVALDNTAGVLSPDRSPGLIDGIVAARRSAEVVLRLMPSFGMSLSNVHAVLHSDDFDLGDLTTDPQGGYSARVTIPATVPVGMHIIEVVGTAADGTIYKALSPAIIVGSLDDEDADGVLDDEDKWPFRTAPIDKTGSKEGEQLKLIGSASPQFLKSGIAQEGREGAAAYIVSHDTTRSQIDNQVPGLMGGLGVSEKNSSTDIDVATVAPLLAFVLLCILVFLLRRRSKGAQ